MNQNWNMKELSSASVCIFKTDLLSLEHTHSLWFYLIFQAAKLISKNKIKIKLSVNFFSISIAVSLYVCH